MSRRSGVQIIVIDDVSRFALHLWRYLAGTPGFGIGDISSASEGSSFWKRTNDGIDLPSGLETPLGDATVWWVEARGSLWKDQIKKVMTKVGGSAQSEESRRFFVVDIRGAVGSGDRGSAARLERYRFSEVVDHLESDHQGKLWQGVAEELLPAESNRILLVSSYWRRVYLRTEKESRLAAVYSKTGSTFERILVRQILGRKRREILRWNLEEGCHLLVTGAGFELMDTSIPGESLGIPETSSLIEKALEAKSYQTVRVKRAKRKSFPLPAKHARSEDSGHLQKAARDGDLDLYWDEFLRLELASYLTGGTPRADGKRAGFQAEFELREALRSALVRHDWGHLQQALGAAVLPFQAWLTTNYTRFANRGIDLVDGSLKKNDENRKPWRIVATSNEAKRLQQFLVHSEELSSEASSSKDSHRYLFKLHGDIPHVTTMALAGHDKEIYSPLSVPIDSLHEVYSAAERWLERLVRAAPSNETICWHIAGHGLWDRPLLRMIRRICRVDKERRHVFLLVNPDHKGRKDKSWTRLVRALPVGEEVDCRFTVLCVEGTAKAYVARLLRVAAGDGNPGKERIDSLASFEELGVSFGRRRSIPWMSNGNFSKLFTGREAQFRIAWCHLA